MLFIDMTTELAPILYGLNGLLVVSGAAIVGSVVAPMIRARIKRRQRPQLVIRRPVFVGHGSR